MAFGAREVRLFLSIQSYGTGNIQRLRRDIMQLNATARGANASQLAVQRQIDKLGTQQLKKAQQIAATERRALGARGVGPYQRRVKLLERLNTLNVRGIVLDRALAGTAQLKNREAQALVNSVRQIDAAETDVLRKLSMEQAEYDALVAEATRLAEVELKRAAILDTQVARMERLLAQEAKLRLAAHSFRTMQFGGLIGLATTGVAANSFANFNKQLTLAATQARGVDQPFAVVAQRATELQNGFDQAGVHFKGILDLMQEFPATGEEMAQAAYDIYSSMTVSFGGGLKLLRSFNQLAVATGSDLATAVDAGITVLNNFSNASGTVNDKLNLMVTIIRYGRMRLADLNAMLEKVAPAATASGQSLQDVAGAMVAITRLQPSQRVGATGIARLLQTFRDPDFQKGANALGVNITRSGTGVGKLKPLPDIIQAMAKNFGLFEKFGGPGKLFQELTATGRGRGIGRQSRIEAQNAFVFLVGHVKEYLALQKAATGDTKEFAAALKAMSESPGVRWQIFLNQLKAFVLVVGESVLPALLKVADKVANVIHWFQGLNRGLREGIGSFFVYGSAILLVVGTLGNMVSSLLAAGANLKIMRMNTALLGAEAEATAFKTTALASSLQILAGIGIIAIPIVMQLIKGGDPGLWDFLGAAGAGAAGGAMLGSAIAPGIGTLVGAGVGAIAVPITIDLISHFQGGKGPKDAAEKAYAEYAEAWKRNFGTGGKTQQALMSFDEWLKRNPMWMKRHQAALKKHGDTEGSLLEKYNKTFRDSMKEQLADANAQSKKLQAAYDKQNQGTSEANKRAIALQKAHTNAIQRAMENRRQAVEQATDKVMEIYQNFESQNRQALGALAQGPVMQGILGNVFSGLNDMLRQFGVQIPIPFTILKKDLDLQLTYFKRWRRDLNKLLARGAPLELVQEVQAMGPEAGIPIAEGLLQGGKKGFRSLIKEWKTGQKLIRQTSKKDMDAQLKDWEKYGHDIAWKIINGLASDPAQAKLRTGFKQYVSNTFGDVLQKQFKKDVQQYMQQAMQDLNASAVTGAAPAGPGGSRGAGAGGRRGVAPITQMTMRQAQATVRRLNRREARLYAQVQRENARYAPGIGEHRPLGPAARAYNQAVRQEAQARARIAQIRHRELLNVRGQIRAGRGRHEPVTSVTYHGDTYNIKSTMTAKEFMRLVRNQQWRKRHKAHRT